MKVLMTTDAVGGVWTYTVELCRGLARENVDVDVACMGPHPSADAVEQLTGLPNVEYHHAGFKLEWMTEPWDDVERAGDWLLDLAEDARPDVVHLNGFAHGNLPWKPPVLVVGHSCLYSWWDAVRGDAPPPDSWKRYRREVRRGLREADRVVAPTRGMLRALSAHYGPLPPPRVIPNGRGVARFTPAPEKEAFVLAAGRAWDPAKNFTLLDAVAPQLPGPVLVAGDPAPPEAGATAAMEHVRLLGKVPAAHLRGLYARSAVFCLPGRYEPFGLTALEAAHAGCALVLGDIPTLREVWGEAALYVDPDDEAGLETALSRLLSDPSFAKERGRRARRHATTYTPEAMAREYLECYHELVRGEWAAPPRQEGESCAS